MLRPNFVYYWPTSFQSTLSLLLSAFLILLRYRKSCGTSHYTTLLQISNRLYIYVILIIYKTLYLSQSINLICIIQELSVCLSFHYAPDTETHISYVSVYRMVSCRKELTVVSFKAMFDSSRLEGESPWSSGNILDSEVVVLFVCLGFMACQPL